MSQLQAWVRRALWDVVPRDHRQTDRELRRRQLVTIGFVLLGAVVLGFSLRLDPGSQWFYPAGLLLAAVWAVGAFASGPLHLGRIPFRERDSRPVFTPILLGLLLGGLYGLAAGYRMVKGRRERVDAPVLCVGNLTVGGSGKTPVAIALARHARRMQLKPGFLSRGYGGAAAGPHLVDPDKDGPRLVGDEALLLAEHGPVAVARNRVAGAALLLEHGADFLIMDDGFQSAQIHMDYALVVVDGRYGIGNGHVLPGGPLRARLIDQVRFATGIVRMGEDKAGEAVVRQAARAGRPIFDAWLRARGADKFANRRFLAFAGIGHPDKFFHTVTRVGGTIVMSPRIAPSASASRSRSQRKWIAAVPGSSLACSAAWI